MECDNMKKRDSHPSQMQEPSIETDKLSYEIFSILESKFLFGYDDQKLWLPKQIAGAGMDTKQDISPPTPPPAADSGNITAIKNQRGKVCILSIDGGGMRGIISGKALAYLEQALKTKSGDPDARIADYFDIAAGTGMGGVFTAMLFSGNSADNRPVYRADDTWKFLAEQSKGFFRGFHRGGGGIFRRIVKGNKRPQTGTATGGMEKAMKGLFSSTTLKDTLKPVLIPCYDLSTSAPFLFSRADALETGSFDFRLWEVCRATSAEPGVFEPMAMKSTDGATRCVGVNGGLAMCNPAAAAITHVLHNKQEFPFVRGVEDLLVLSLGSGQLMEANYEYEQVKGWKAREWAGPTARIAGDSAADLVDHAVAMAFGQSGSGNYVRIQANGSKVGRWQANVDSDPSLSNVKMMMGVADEMLEQKNVGSLLFGGKKVDELTNAQKLDWFAGELVLEHQRRGCRIAPTVAFKQSTQTLT